MTGTNFAKRHVEGNTTLKGTVPEREAVFKKVSENRDVIHDSIFDLLATTKSTEWYEIENSTPEDMEEYVEELLRVDTPEHRSLYQKLLESGATEGVWCTLEQILAQQMNREMFDFRLALRSLFEEQEGIVAAWDPHTMDADECLDKLDQITMHILNKEMGEFHVMESFDYNQKHTLELLIMEGNNKVLDIVEEYAEGRYDDDGETLREGFKKYMPYHSWLQKYCYTGKVIPRHLAHTIYEQTRMGVVPLQDLQDTYDRQREQLYGLRKRYGNRANGPIKHVNHHISEVEIVPYIARSFPNSPRELETVFQYLHLIHMDHWDQKEESDEYDSRDLGGKYRSQAIGVGDHMGVSASSVPAIMKEFTEILWSHMQTMRAEGVVREDHLQQLAVWAYVAFLDIHPFMGGNGRTARSIYQYIIELLGVEGDYGNTQYSIPIVADEEGDEMGVNSVLADAIEMARSRTKSKYIHDYQKTTPWDLGDLWEALQSIDTQIDFSTFWIQREMKECRSLQYVLENEEVDAVVGSIVQNGYPGIIIPELGHFFVRLMRTLQRDEEREISDAYAVQEEIISYIMTALYQHEHGQQQKIAQLLLMKRDASERVIDIVQLQSGDTIELLNNYFETCLSAVNSQDIL